MDSCDFRLVSCDFLVNRDFPELSRTSVHRVWAAWDVRGALSALAPCLPLLRALQLQLPCVRPRRREGERRYLVGCFASTATAEAVRPRGVARMGGGVAAPARLRRLLLRRRVVALLLDDDDREAAAPPADP